MTQMIQIPSGYHQVLLTAVILSMQCLLFGFIFAGKARSKTFTQQFLNENFGTEHKEVFGKQITRGGYPDIGSGYYAQKLSYKDWYVFNTGQRIHMNFVQMISSSLVFLLVAGLQCSCWATRLGVLMIVARLIYSIGYSSSGPNGRIVGALLNDIAILGLFIMSMMYCVNALTANQSTPEVPAGGEM